MKVTLKNKISHVFCAATVVVFGLPFLAGCATVSASRSDGAGSTLTDSQKKSLLATEAPQGDLSDTGSDLEQLPMEVNKQVLQWIDYFQGRGRPHMERYLSRSTRYMPIMKKILKEQGLPEDLIYIALIESGFSGTAKSSAKAVGYWQFIRPTGRRYGLKVDNYVDERRDFAKSTVAAADYFKGLYNLFGAWYLAIASYNVGENRVKNLVMKYHTRDFWKLARENKLPDETQNYVPKFLAARLIAKEPEKYGFTDIEYMPPLDFAEVKFETSIDLRKLAKALNIEYDDLRDLNASYKKGVAFDQNHKLTLRVPKGMEALALAAAPQAAAGSRAVYVADEDYGYYRIRRGDTVASIAKKFGASQKEIRDLNKMRGGFKIVSGRRIRVPAENVSSVAAADTESGKSGVKKNSAAGSRKPTNIASTTKSTRLKMKTSGPKRKIHVVRKGDTLVLIAKRYQVSLRELMDQNQLNHRARIPIGAQLEIP